MVLKVGAEDVEHESPKEANWDTEGVEGYSPPQQDGVGQIF